MSYFDSEKKKKAVESLSIMSECAQKAGIFDDWFVGFGLLLGIVRERDFIGHDNDVDMCIRADNITEEQELHYINLLAKEGKEVKELKRLEEYKNEGLFFARKKWMIRKDTNRYVWFSLRKRSDYPKFCHWMFYNHNNYAWHTKGKAWISEKKFKSDNYGYDTSYDAIMKGIPAQYIETLHTIDFYGIKINIPFMVGSCLDEWYPGWRVPMKGGSSLKRYICIVKDWNTPKKWKTKKCM